MDLDMVYYQPLRGDLVPHVVVRLEVVCRLDGDVADDGAAPRPAVPHEPHPPIDHLQRQEVPLLRLPRAAAAAGQVSQEAVPVSSGVNGVYDAVETRRRSLSDTIHTLNQEIWLYLILFDELEVRLTR